MEKLASDGGTPIRREPFPTKMLGVSFIGEDELKELQDVVESKSPFRHYGISTPHKVADFEKSIKEYMGCKYALAVSSGTSALLCAMAAMGIGPEDEVILTGFGWYSDYFAIVNSGALPVFADIDDSLNLDPADFERKLTDRTKAVIVIHYQGGAANMDEIMRIAKTRNIKVIEDCAQAFGGEYKGKKLGTIGDSAIASFQANKMISCGEGGLYYTNNEEYFVRAVRYHDLGFVRPVFKEQLENKALAEPLESFAGLQFRMSELQGAFMLAQFRRLPMILTKCRKYHEKIMKHFVAKGHFIFRMITDGDCGITLFMKFGTVLEAKKFSDCLKAEGISVGPSSACTNIEKEYPVKNKRLANPLMPPFGRGFAGENTIYDSNKDCPNMDNIINSYVAIGIGPQYSEEDINDIIKGIEKVDRFLYA